MRTDGERGRINPYMVGGGAATVAVGAAVPVGAHVAARRAEVKAEQLSASLHVPELRTTVPPFLPHATVTQRVAFPDAASERVPRAVTDDAAKSVVEIQHGSGVGSGWAAARDLIVTAHHVVAGADSQLRIASHGRHYPVPVQVIAVDAARDVALIHAPGIGIPALPTATRPLDARRALQILGHPTDRAGRVIGVGASSPLSAIDTTAVGRTVGTSRDRDVTHVVSVTDHASPELYGASGGPLIDSEGLVRAVTHGGSRLAGADARKVSATSTDVRHVNELVDKVSPQLDAWRRSLGASPDGVVHAVRAAADTARQLRTVRLFSIMGGAVAATAGAGVALGGVVAAS